MKRQNFSFLLTILCFLLTTVFLVSSPSVFAQFDFGNRRSPAKKEQPARESGGMTPRQSTFDVDVQDDVVLESDDEQDEEETNSESESEDIETDSSGLEYNGPRFGQSATKTWTTGVKLKAVSRCFDMVFLIPIPMNWPEQDVTILEEKATNDFAEISRRVYSDGGLEQMIVKVKELQPGRATEASLMVKATRREILPPTPKSIAKLRIPIKTTKDLKIHLEPAPQVESNKVQFKTLYRTITKDIESDWDKIEAVYKYVQDNIEYNEEDKKKTTETALSTLKNKRGDCKGMTAVFVAICRAGRVPARTVWIPGHCYAEFYMVDNNGRGYWFPCQVSGTYAFGGIPEMGPVLQKGDNFKFRELRGEKFRLVAPQVVGQNEGGPGEQPKCEFFGVQYTGR